MQDRHIALRREALVAKGEETLVARAEALEVLRAWMLRTFVGLFPPPYPHRQSNFFQCGALICYVFLRPEVNRLCPSAESDEPSCCTAVENRSPHPTLRDLPLSFRSRVRTL